MAVPVQWSRKGQCIAFLCHCLLSFLQLRTLNLPSATTLPALTFLSLLLSPSLSLSLSAFLKVGILAELDRVNLEAELESQTSNMMAAKVEFEYQQRNFNRSKELHAKQMISDSEYELAEYNYLKSKNSYNKTCSDIVKSKTNLSKERELDYALLILIN